MMAIALGPMAGATTYTVTTATDFPVTGGTITVTASTGVINNGTGNGQVTLRSAVLAANMSGVGPHTINVPAGLGTYNLTQLNPNTPTTTSTLSMPDLEVGCNLANVTITGTGGTAKIVQTITAGNFFGGQGNDVFSLSFSDVSGDLNVNSLTLNNLEITGGSFAAIFHGGDDGSGHICNLTINNCNIHDNYNHDNGGGGAIFFSSGNLTITNSTFANNTTTATGGQGNGGAIYYAINNTIGAGSTGSLSISGTTFTNNSSGSGSAGGAISMQVSNKSGQPTDTITGCTFNGDSAGSGGDGGALSAGGGRPLNITGCTFTNDSVTGAGKGGAIEITNGVTNITYCRFSGDTAPANSGKDVYHTIGNTDTVTVNDDWYGEDAGPKTNDLIGAITEQNYLVFGMSATSTTLHAGQTTTVTLSFLKDSANNTISASNLTALVGLPVSFTNTTGGSVSTGVTIQSSGTASATFTAGSVVGTAVVEGNVDSTAVADGATVNVNIINTAPTINAITPNPLNLVQGAGLQTVNFSGVTIGANETGQTLSVSATSNNTALIPNPTVTYTSPNSTGSLSFTPVGGQFGTATITVTVTDSGGTANGGQNSTTAQFVVNVASLNHAPTISAISNPPSIPVSSGQQTVNFSGVADGDGGTQTLTVTATSNNTALIPNPTVTYTSPNATGSLSYTPVAGVTGNATITVKVQDNGGTANGGVDSTTTTFIVTVVPINQPPTIDAIGNQTALENAGQQSVNLTGISDGTGETGQTITITATSDNTAVVPNPTIVYTSPNATGTLNYTPVANAFGVANVTVTVKDNGGTAFGGVDTTTRTFSITVTHVNQAPTLNAISDPASIPESSGLQTVNLSGITQGPGDTGQTLTVTATSNNTALIPNPTVTYTSPNATGSLSYTPSAGVSGSATITVKVQDNGGTANGGVDTTTRTFTVVVTPINHVPTIDPIGNQTALENAGQQSVGLTGISDGVGDTGQTITVTATSDNTAVVPNPTIVYTSPNATGTLNYTPVANKSGTANITVTVKDSGGTANGGVDTTTRTFSITITPVNQAPTITTIPGISIQENAGQQTVNFSGVTDGPGDTGQTLTVTATSSNTALVPNPTVTYTSPNATGSLSFTPVANVFGTSTITVTVQDNGGVANGGVDTTTTQFVVTVTRVNQIPTIATINPLTILENASQQTVNLSGITAGAGDGDQTITVTATSSNTGLIPNPTVTYTSPNATGSLSFTPVSNTSGTSTITVTVQDNGGTANGGTDTKTTQFLVTVTAVNQAPTINAITDPASIGESSGLQTVNFSGVTDGPGDTGQTITVTATSNNTALIPNPTVTYTSPNTTGSLSYTPMANQIGSAVITVTVKDSGGTANGGVDTTTRTFNVTVVAVNHAPTLDPVGNQTVLENVAQQTINLTGISDGPGDTGQTITITAISDNTTVVPNPTVTYTSPGTTGTLSYTPVANTFGVANITVTVKDNGGTALGGIDTLVRTFSITVTHVNQAPTLNAITDPASIAENAGQQTVNLSGISAGPGDAGQTLAITATSSNTGLIPNPTVTYTSPNATGTLTYTPVANTSGSATITVTVQDSGGTANGGVDTTTRTFNVVVFAVNQRPTLDAISNQTVLENATQQTVNLTGITDGAGDTGQTLTVTATSDNTAVVPNPTITYTSPNATGSLSFTPVANTFGTANITVTVKDNGGTANEGNDTTQKTFSITVTRVNQAPTIAAIGPVTIPQNSGLQTVSLSGISAGAGDGDQAITVTATSDNTSLIPNPTVTYTSPNATGSLTFTPAANTSGTANITVTVHDNGGTTNGGVDTTTTVFSVKVQQPVLVTFQTSVPGLSYTVDEVTYTSTQVISLNVGTSHTISTTTPQTLAAHAGTQYVFSNWSDEGAISHSIEITEETTSFTANFTTQYQLTTAVNPPTAGTVTPGSGQYFDANSSVPISTTSAGVLVFDNWTGPVTAPGNTSTTVTMTEPLTVTANYIEATPSARYSTGGQVPGEPTGLKFLAFGIPSLDNNNIGFAATAKVANGTVQKLILGGNPTHVLYRSGGTAPGVTGGTFVSFQDPVFGGGHTAFIATMKNGTGINATNNVGVWSDAFGSLQLIARYGSPAPGVSGANIDTVTSLALPPTGGAVFYGKLKHAGAVNQFNDLALWREAGAGNVQLVLRTGDHVAVDGGSPKTISTFVVLTSVLGSPGQHRGYTTDGTLHIRLNFTDSTQAVVASPGTGDPLVVEAFTGDPVTSPSGAKFLIFGVPAANDSSQAFQALLQPGVGGVSLTNNNGIFTGSNGNFASVVQEGDAAPGLQGAHFTTFEDPAVAGEGNVAFLSQLTGAGVSAKASALWTNVFGSLQLIAREGGTVPGIPSAQFLTISSFALPDTSAPRGPVFLATLKNGVGGVNGTNNVGLWATTSGGNVVPIVRTGDKITFGSTQRPVKGITALGFVAGSPGQGRALNSTGSITYRLSFNSAFQCIFTAPIP